MQIFTDSDVFLKLYICLRFTLCFIFKILIMLYEKMSLNFTWVLWKLSSSGVFSILCG